MMENYLNDDTAQSGGQLYLCYPESDRLAMRRCRNLLENRGFSPQVFRPVMSEGNTLPPSVKAEIDAHHLALLLEPSDPTALTAYEQAEREYLRSRSHMVVLTLKLGDDAWLTYELDQIARHLRYAVFAIDADSETAERFRSALIRRHYLVNTAPEPRHSPEEIDCFTRSRLLEAAEESSIIAIVSARMVRDPFRCSDIVRGLANGRRIVPVILGRPKGLTDDFRFYCAKSEYYCISDPPTEREIAGVVARIGRNLVRSQEKHWRRVLRKIHSKPREGSASSWESSSETTYMTNEREN